jgi:hypothetical protein
MADRRHISVASNCWSDMERRIEENSVRLSFILNRHVWEVNNEINIQEIEWEGALRGLIWLRIRTCWGLLRTR